MFGTRCMLTKMIRHVVAMTTTKWHQVEPSQDPSHFAWISGTSLFYNQVEPSGSKWIRIRIRATLLGILRPHFFTTKWIQVDPSQDPSCLLGILAKTISAPSLNIILIKSRDSRIQGPQNEINCRILYTNKNQKLISHRSESDVCEMVLLIFLGNVGGTRLPNGAFMQKASCQKWHELSAHRRGIFCLSPNPFHKHMFLTCAFL